MAGKIKKPSVFITSTGRTGTQFLARNIGFMVENAAVYHEPGSPWISRPLDFVRKTRNFGLYNMTFGQLSPKHCMFKLSRKYLVGELDKNTAAGYIGGMRKKFVDDAPGELYVESSGHIYGVLDILDDLFENVKFIHIVRDPKKWVTSALNTFEYYLYGPLDEKLLRMSPTAKDFSNDGFTDKWEEMSKFEKYCWFYNKLNEYVINSMSGKNNFRIYRFEDIFNPDDTSAFDEMIAFATDFHFKNFSYSLNPDLLRQKEHSKASGRFPKFHQWDRQMFDQLKRHCGRWIRKFDYQI